MGRSAGSIHPASRSGGFTLLEMLLAFVVFALSFATVLEILSGTLRNTVRARQYTEAALTAQSVMGQVGLEIVLEAGTRAQGDFGDYSWELEISEYQSAEGGMGNVELAELTGAPARHLAAAGQRGAYVDDVGIVQIIEVHREIRRDDARPFGRPPGSAVSHGDRKA